MKATELRLGNRVKSDNATYRPQDLGKELCVLEIKDEVITVVPVKDLPAFTFGQFLKYITPIQLTEEWLIKLGFDSIKADEENCNIDYTLTDDPQYWIQNHTEVNEYVFYGLSNSIDKPIRYVHQLQNLIFALTDKEIEIKE